MTRANQVTNHAILEATLYIRYDGIEFMTESFYKMEQTVHLGLLFLASFQNVASRVTKSSHFLILPLRYTWPL